MHRALPVLSVLPVLATAAPVPPALFHCIDPNLEVTVWAASPLLRNPTNIDIDQHGRIWVAEGVNYRKHFDRQPEGDRIMVLEDTDGDGKADKSWPFVQEKFLRAPLGVAVIGNKVVVSMAPDLIVYTDKDGDAVFDAAKGDTREVLLTGFNGRNHDHSLHSVTVGPDGKWYFSAGNCGAKFTDKSGKTFRIAAKQNVSWWPKDPARPDWDPNEIAGQKSDDGRVYVGGFIARMDPDGSNVEILAHNLRNSFENCVTSYGDIFASDNDDQPACRVFWVLEGGNYGFASADGQRPWQADRRPGQSIQTATWRQEDPGVAPAGDIYGGGAPTGCVFYENGALDQTGGARLQPSPNQTRDSQDSAGASPHQVKAPRHEGTLLVCESARNTIFGYKPQPDGAGWKLDRFDFLTTNKAGEFAGTDFKGGNQGIKADDTKTLFRPSDIAVGPDGALYISDWHDPRTGGHADMDDALEGTIYRVAPKGFKSVVPKIDLTTVEGAIAALQSPAVHVRAVSAARLRQLKPLDREDKEALTVLVAEVGAFVRARLSWLEPRKNDPDLSAEENRFAASWGPRIAALREFVRSRKPAGADDKAATKDTPGMAMMLREAIRLMLHSSKDRPLGAFIQALDEMGFDGDVSLELFRQACVKLPEGFRREIMFREMFRPLKWGDRGARLFLAVHPPELIPAFQLRALSPALPLQARLDALTAIGFNDTAEAAQAMLEVVVNLNVLNSEKAGGSPTRPEGKPENPEAAPRRTEGASENTQPPSRRTEGHSENTEPLPRCTEGTRENAQPPSRRTEGHSENAEPLPRRTEGASENTRALPGRTEGPSGDSGPSAGARVRETALWWLLNRKDSTWKAHGLNAALKERGLYDPEKITLLPAPLPAPVASPFTVADAAKLPGDAKRGEAVSAKCFLCHKIGDQGADYGPDLTTFGRMQTTEALLRSIIEPDADLAHGFAGTRLETGDGMIIEGLLLSESDPLVIRSAGGVTQMVPAARVKSKSVLTRSLMMSAAQLGLTAQEAADLAAYLRAR